jgi:hypothetical protein
VKLLELTMASIRAGDVGFNLDCWDGDVSEDPHLLADVEVLESCDTVRCIAGHGCVALGRSFNTSGSLLKGTASEVNKPGAFFAAEWRRQYPEGQDVSELFRASWWAAEGYDLSMLTTDQLEAELRECTGDYFEEERTS